MLRTSCGRSLGFANATLGMTGMYVIATAVPFYVIPTGAKRSGGILALPCFEPAAVDPSTSLGMTLLGVALRSGCQSGESGAKPPYVMTTGAKRSGGILAPSSNEPAAKDPSTSLGMTPLGVLRSGCQSGESGAKPPYVMTTGAKRSGGILAPSCNEPTAKDPSTSLGMTPLGGTSLRMTLLGWRCARDDRKAGRQRQ